MNARHAWLVLAIGAVAATGAEAQNQYQQQITAQFTRWNPTFQQRGLLPIGSPFTGSLNDNSDESILVNLTAGARYAIAGVCDADCNDVDLQIFSSDGTKIGEDVDTDDRPVVMFNAGYTGQYRVKILMPGCTTSPCYYGVQIYSGAGGK